MGHGHMVKVPFLPQARKVASKRPGNDPVSLPLSKRVCAFPPAQTESSPVDADDGQVKLPRWRGKEEPARGSRPGGTRDHLCPHRLPSTWNPCTSCSVIAETTAPRTWRPSCGPVPLSRPGRRVRAGPMGSGRFGSQGGAQQEARGGKIPRALNEMDLKRERKGQRAGPLLKRLLLV